MGAVAELFAIQAMSQSGVDTRIFYGTNGEIEYVGVAGIGVATSLQRWKMTKFLYDSRKRETRILSDATQQVLDDRVSYFSTKYGV